MLIYLVITIILTIIIWVLFGTFSFKGHLRLIIVFPSSASELCWASMCLFKSILRWNLFSQEVHPNGLYPLCFLICVIRLDDWLNDLWHTTQVWGFSPNGKRIKLIFSNSLSSIVILLFSMFEREIQEKILNSKPSPYRTCMNVRVFFHIWLLMEALSTILTWERPGIWMNQ